MVFHEIQMNVCYGVEFIIEIAKKLLRLSLLMRFYSLVHHIFVSYDTRLIKAS